MDETPRVYLVMEYAGESLAQVIPVRPLSPEEARQMLDPTVDALAYLHTQGFVHGRVQPGNIMAVEDCVKMSTSDVCRAGDCLPVVRDVYTAPEGTASPAADVWSLGVTLVETLTQRPPIGGSIDPVVSATLPQPFLEIARECLRSDPKNRVSAADIAVRLHTELRLAKRPRLKWAYALAAAAGLVIAAVLIAPRLIDQREPVQKTEPAQFPEAQPVPAAPVTPPSAARNPIIQRVLPPVPARASRTIQGRVKLSVLLEVDPSGKVMNARLDPAGPSAYFAQLALQAARRWKFAPATGGDGARPRVWIVHFEFSRTGTKAVPVRKGS
jgi:TonB family protein